MRMRSRGGFHSHPEKLVGMPPESGHQSPGLCPRSHRTPVSSNTPTLTGAAPVQAQRARRPIREVAAPFGG